MIIPANTADLKTGLKSLFAKKPEDRGAKSVKTDATRRTASEIHKEREKRRALAQELADVKTSSDRREQIVAELQTANESLQAALEEANKRVSELEPKAKAHSDFIHKKRSKLLERLPPEERAKEKKIGEAMDIDTFETYIDRITGKPNQGAQPTGKDGKNDWNKMVELATTAEGAAALEKAIASDPAGFNQFSEGK